MTSSPWMGNLAESPTPDDALDDGDTAAVIHLRPVHDDAYPDWEAAYLDNVGRLYGLMFSKVGNRTDAEDLTSEVFRAALGPLRLTASKGEVRAYLLATAATVLAAYWRRRLGLQVTQIDPEVDIRDLAAPSPKNGAHQRALRILTALPDRYRRVLELRFLDSCSIKEAASAMQISVSNAKVLQHRAVRMAARVAEELEL
jgi:RNA polymerase sigma factor (sigma-70 family)